MMAARSGLTFGAVVAGMLGGHHTFACGASAVHVASRWHQRVLGARFGSGHNRRIRRLATGIILVPIALPSMIVTGMAHATATSAEHEECGRAKRKPDPVAIEPIHHFAPSDRGIIGFVLPLYPSRCPWYRSPKLTVFVPSAAGDSATMSRITNAGKGVQTLIWIKSKRSRATVYFPTSGGAWVDLPQYRVVSNVRVDASIMTEGFVGGPRQ
jgi:hypothetical protein